MKPSGSGGLLLAACAGSAAAAACTRVTELGPLPQELEPPPATAGAAGGASSDGQFRFECPEPDSPQWLELWSFEGLSGDASGAGWVTIVDGSSGQQSARFSGVTGAPCASSVALELSASGFTNWGSGIGVDLVASSGGGDQYLDATGFYGLRFAARADPPIELSVKLADRATRALNMPGCTPCSQPFVSVVAVGREFQTIVAPFAAFEPDPAYSDQAAQLDAIALHSVELLMPGGGSYSLWIDDLYLVR